MDAWKKEKIERDKKKAELEASISDKIAADVWNRAVYDFNPLAFGSEPYSKLDDQQKRMIKRIVAVAQQVKIKPKK